MQSRFISDSSLRAFGVLLVLLVAAGCTEGTEPTGALIADLDGDGTPDELPDDVVDHRRDFDLPEGDNYLFVEMPDLLVAAGEERFFCLFGTWDGPEMTVVSLLPYRSPEYFHHGLMKAPVEEDKELGQEGRVLDCSSQRGYEGNPVLFEAVGRRRDNPLDWINLPPGVGFRLPEGQRYYGDVHYVNVSDHPILVNAVFALELEPASEDGSYVGAFNHDGHQVMVPPGGEHDVRSDCTWESDVSILTIAGHMHGHGTEYAVDWYHSNGSEPDRLYEVLNWQPDYQFGSPALHWEIGETEVQAGDTFTTHCTWDNNTEHTLEFPDEMCTTFGVAYPMPESLYCIGTPSTRQPPQ